MGAAGLALASSLSGIILFWLTIKAFGKAQFFAIIAHKYALYLFAGLGVLTLILLQLKELLSAYL